MEIKNPFLIFITLPLVFSAFYALFSIANGGDQRVVEGKYMINLSRAPFTPRAYDKVQMLASFVDLRTNKFVSEDLIVRVRISRLGGGGSVKRTFVFDQENFQVRGGVLDLTYTFQDAGLHEVFFDFALTSNPDKVYEAPDFLLDIQRPETKRTSPIFLFLLVIGGTAFGFILGWFVKRRRLSLGEKLN